MPRRHPSYVPREATDRSFPARADFSRLVHDALKHLHDPVYLQTHRLVDLLPAGSLARSRGVGRALHEALLEAVEALSPVPSTSSDSRSSLSYQILKLRFVDGAGTPEVQAKLAIGHSTYYLEQAQALEAVSSYLWERWVGDGRSSAEPRTITASLRLAPSAGPSNNLPVQLTSFVGREREGAEVKGLLGHTRLLTLTGAGGCGKTRLALQVGGDLVDRYSDGIWFVDLAPLSDPGLVPPTVALTLGLREPPRQSIIDTIQEYLKAKRLLLVLDNCEHLIDACAQLVDALLRACPQVRVLATSREGLGVAGETNYRVPSLSLPDPLRMPPPSSLSQYQSRSLCSPSVPLRPNQASPYPSRTRR